MIHSIRFRPLNCTAVGWIVLLSVLSGCGGSASPEQKQAVARFQDLGGRVNFKRGGYEVDLRNTATQDADLAHLKHIANLKTLDLRGTEVTDTGVSELHGIVTLETIELGRVRITSEAVGKLKQSLPKADVNY